jgi:hypothetical protein
MNVFLLYGNSGDGLHFVGPVFSSFKAARKYCEAKGLKWSSETREFDGHMKRPTKRARYCYYFVVLRQQVRG